MVQLAVVACTGNDEDLPVQDSQQILKAGKQNMMRLKTLKLLASDSDIGFL
jgi:hypothetical protein